MDSTARTLVRRASLAACLALLVSLVGVAPARAQPISGDATATGFQAATATRFVIREGQWFPIVCRLTVPGSQVFQGFARVERSDLDGDRVEFLERPVTVSSGVQKKVWLYATMDRSEVGRPIDIDLVADDRVRVNTLNAPLPEQIGNDTMIVLDLSEPQLTGLQSIDSKGSGYVGLNFGSRNYYRPICVANMPSRDLPDRWFGLEAADVIVWDEPDPDALSPAQLEALMEWVRWGGQLVIGLGSAGPRVAKSPLLAILPFAEFSQTTEVPRLPVFPTRFSQSEVALNDKPIVVSRVEAAAGALVTVRDQLMDGTVVPLIAMRQVGSGRVIASATRIRDLLPLGGAGNTGKVVGEFIDLNATPAAMKAAEGDKGLLGLSIVTLYRSIVEAIEFRALASLRVLGAFGFVAAYIVLATFVMWAWLKSRSATYLSWSVFAGFAVVASFVSLGAVSLFSGFSHQLATVSYVDLEAGKPEARVRAYFGYKSVTRDNARLSLTGDGGFLRPMTSGVDRGQPYATPGRYAAVPGKALLEDAPMRATLKQFEGAWQGKLDGVVRAQLTASRATGQIEPGSYVGNELPSEIAGGFLLYVDPRVQGIDGVPYRVAGMQDRGVGRPSYLGKKEVVPAINVLCVAIGPLKPGERDSALGKSLYDALAKDHARWASRGDAKAEEEPVLRTLWHYQVNEWAEPFRATTTGIAKGVFADFRFNASMLACTRDVYLHNTPASGAPDFGTVGAPISTEGLMNLDVSHWLTRGQAVLLLYARDPGPTMLARSGQPIKPADGFSVYRVRVPIEYSGQPVAVSAGKDSQ